MKLTRVTLTGADDRTDINQLLDLSARYPFVEWGILFSEARMGQDRYPSFDWILELSRRKLEYWREHGQTRNINLSAHICGSWMRMLLHGDQHFLLDCFQQIDHADYTLLGPSHQRTFQRAQLNFNTKTLGVDYNAFGFGLLIPSLHDYFGRLIFQLNRNNEAFLRTITSNVVCDLLVDMSGGRGKELDLTTANSLTAPYLQQYIGYAGGLNPDNVNQYLEELTSRPNKGNDKFFIDMESGVRTNNQFDLKKCEQVLEIAKQYIYK